MWSWVRVTHLVSCATHSRATAGPDSLTLRCATRSTDEACTTSDNELLAVINRNNCKVASMSSLVVDDDDDDDDDIEYVE